MATVTINGIEATPLSEYVTLWQDIYISAYGSTVNVDSETPQGQIIGLAALDFSQIDDVLIDTFNAGNIDTAVGVQIDLLMANIGLERKAAINTQVDIVVTGVPFAVIPAGSRAGDNINNVFLLDSQITLDGIGQGVGVMTAEIAGAIFVEANTLVRIIDAVSGWETVNNPTDGITGQDIETDAAARLRYKQSLGVNALSMLKAIEANLLAITNVDDARVFENFDDTSKLIKNVLVAPHSIAASVLGGDIQEIAETLAEVKGTGVGFTGTTSFNVVDFANNEVTEVSFFETTEIETEIALEIRTDSTFPADGVAQIKKNLVDYFNGEFTGSSGDNSGFGVAENVIFSRLFTPINAVSGFEVTLLLIGRLGDTLSPSDIAIDLNEKSLMLETNINLIQVKV